jgi:hypothetical protein
MTSITARLADEYDELQEFFLHDDHSKTGSVIAAALELKARHPKLTDADIAEVLWFADRRIGDWREPSDEEIARRFLCVDCGADTDATGEYYMVSDDLWAATQMAPNGGMLCLDCLEKRTGRPLILDDFTAVAPKEKAWMLHNMCRILGAKLQHE